MIRPIAVLFVLLSAIGLVFGLSRKNMPALFALSALWWLGAFASAYFTFLAWMDRGYSENWAMMGFLYLTLPYAALTLVLILVTLYFMRGWREARVKLLRGNLLALLAFLALQLILGFMLA